MPGQTQWSRASGPVLTLLSVAAIELLSHTRLHIPDPAAVFYLNVIVLYAAFSGRLPSGLISGSIVSLYLCYQLSIRGKEFHYTIGDLSQVTVIALASPAIALIVGIWKRYAEQALEISRANAILQAQTTEHKRGEEALRRSEANYRSLIERAPYGIYRASLDGKILMVNSALVNMLRYASKAELLAANLFTDIYRNLAQRPPLIEHLRNQELFEGVEVEWQRRDGEPITVRLSGRLVREEDGALPYFEVVAEVVRAKDWPKFAATKQKDAGAAPEPVQTQKTEELVVSEEAGFIVQELWRNDRWGSAYLSSEAIQEHTHLHTDKLAMAIQELIQRGILLSQGAFGPYSLNPGKRFEIDRIASLTVSRKAASA